MRKAVRLKSVFKSKRNEVSLQDGIVVKKLKTPGAARLEYEFLSQLYLQGVPVPKAKLAGLLTIQLEYIDGVPLPDYLDEIERNGDAELINKVADALAEWLVIFYKAVDHKESGEIRGDINGRNFLYADGLFYGVDFEEHCYGDIEQDIGRLIAFATTYNPPDTTVKLAFAERFNKAMGKKIQLNESLVQEYRLQELASMNVRRRSR